MISFLDFIIGSDKLFRAQRVNIDDMAYTVAHGNPLDAGGGETLPV